MARPPFYYVNLSFPLWKSSFSVYLCNINLAPPATHLIHVCWVCLSVVGMQEQNTTDEVAYAQTYFSRLWRLESQDQGPAWLGSSEGPVLGHRFVVVWPGSLWSLFYKGPCPVHEGSARGLTPPKKASLLILSSLRVIFNMRVWEEIPSDHSITLFHSLKLYMYLYLKWDSFDSI